MISRKNKKAQYYLLAAAVIVAVLIGVSFVTNYAITRKEPVRFYDLSAELKEECARLIDYGIHSEIDSSSLIDSFIEENLIKYVGQKDIEVDFVFIYGEKENIKIATNTDEILEVGRVPYETIFEDVDEDYVCDGGTIGALNLINQNVLLRDCIVNGKVELTGGGGLKIDSSTITGNNMIVVSTGTNLELINSYVGGKVDVSGAGDKFIINNTVGGDVLVGDGTLFITDNTIGGNLRTSVGHCPEIVQIGDNDVGGTISLCRGASISIIVELFNNTYNVNSQEGTNCFFILAKEIDGEVYIAESEGFVY